MFLIEPRIQREWWIVFEHFSTRKWYNKYLKKGFAHCYALGLCEDTWVIVNPTDAVLDIELRPVADYPTARAYVGEYAKIIRVEVSLPSEHSSWSFGVMSCVDVMKKLIGLKAWWIVTPWQLYKELSDEQRFERWFWFGEHVSDRIKRSKTSD